MCCHIKRKLRKFDYEWSKEKEQRYIGTSTDARMLFYEGMIDEAYEIYDLYQRKFNPLMI